MILSELKALAEAATKGPWRTGSLESYFADGTPFRCVYRLDPDDPEETATSRIHVGGSPKLDCDADAAHIAAFNPATALTLISALEDATREREFYKDAIGKLWEQFFENHPRDWVTREELCDAIKELGFELEDKK